MRWRGSGRHFSDTSIRTGRTRAPSSHRWLVMAARLDLAHRVPIGMRDRGLRRCPWACRGRRHLVLLTLWPGRRPAAGPLFLLQGPAQVGPRAPVCCPGFRQATHWPSRSVRRESLARRCAPARFRAGARCRYRRPASGAPGYSQRSKMRSDLGPVICCLKRGSGASSCCGGSRRRARDLRPDAVRSRTRTTRHQAPDGGGFRAFQIPYAGATQPCEG